MSGWYAGFAGGSSSVGFRIHRHIRSICHNGGRGSALFRRALITEAEYYNNLLIKRICFQHNKILLGKALLKNNLIIQTELIGAENIYHCFEHIPVYCLKIVNRFGEHPRIVPADNLHTA